MVNPLLKPAPLAHMLTAIVFTPRQILLHDWVGAAGLLLYAAFVFCAFMPKEWGEVRSWMMALFGAVVCAGLLFSLSSDLMILAAMAGMIGFIYGFNAVIEVFAPPKHLVK